MEENLANHRQSYEKFELSTENLTDNPMELFKKWFDEIEEKDKVSENNAMTLSTIDAQGFPKNRIVLLKKFNDDGFIFYTNYTSEKGQSIIREPKVSISFFWPLLERQVIVKGEAVKLPSTVSDQYFKTRPRGSQLGAWVSHQSQPIKNREVLNQNLNIIKEKFKNEEVIRPKFWGGFLIKPIYIEFWQGRANRLHDRFSYVKNNGEWTISRLAP